MKKIIFLFLFFACCMNISAQTISAGTTLPIGKPKIKVVDSADVCVFYQYDYRLGGKNYSGQTILLLGQKFGGFYDYYGDNLIHLQDSLSKAAGSSVEFMGKSLVLGKKKVYNTPIIFSLDSMIATVQMHNVFEYQYTQPMPKIDWQAVDAPDTTVAGVVCKKATCDFGGRRWVACYAPSMPVGLGPYLFNGLPGLIFSVRDSAGTHGFTLNGLTNLKEKMPIYLSTNEKIIKTSREKARRAVENEKRDFIKAFLASAPGTVFPDGMQAGDRSIPYDPIELK